MKAMIFFFLFVTSFAFSGEKGNGLGSLDERFMDESYKLCPNIVAQSGQTSDESITIEYEDGPVIYRRSEVIRFCCENVSIGPACVKEIRM